MFFDNLIMTFAWISETYQSTVTSVQVLVQSCQFCCDVLHRKFNFCVKHLKGQQGIFQFITDVRIVVLQSLDVDQVVDLIRSKGYAVE